MDALTLLRLQIEWGADEALEDAPVDRLRPGGNADGGRGLAPTLRRPNHPPSSTAGDGPVPAAATLREPAAFSPAAFSPAAASPASPRAITPAERAAAAAGQAQTLEDLRATLAAFDGCALRDTASNPVFAAGAPGSALLLIGDPPGEAEDRSGNPLVGPDGVLLDRMLASIGLTRENLLLAPMIPWRPPGGRLPTSGEIAVCLPFLHRLIALIAPARLLLLGSVAARTVLGPARRRATPAWTEIAVPGHAPPIPALAMPSPSMMARTPATRRDAWAALRLLRRTLDADFAKK